MAIVTVGIGRQKHHPLLNQLHGTPKPDFEHFSLHLNLKQGLTFREKSGCEMCTHACPLLQAVELLWPGRSCHFNLAHFHLVSLLSPGMFLGWLPCAPDCWLWTSSPDSLGPDSSGSLIRITHTSLNPLLIFFFVYYAESLTQATLQAAEATTPLKPVSAARKPGDLWETSRLSLRLPTWSSPHSSLSRPWLQTQDGRTWLPSWESVWSGRLALGLTEGCLGLVQGTRTGYG